MVNLFLRITGILEWEAYCISLHYISTALCEVMGPIPGFTMPIQDIQEDNWVQTFLMRYISNFFYMLSEKRGWKDIE